MLFLLRPFRILMRAFTDVATPRQLALGFAMGMVIGLVPKGNLIAVVLMMCLCAAKVNLGTGLFAAFAFSWVGTLTDRMAHEIGFTLLNAEQLQPLWTRLYNTPVVPWTDFNSTLVLGNLALGLTLLIPVYLLARPLFARLAPFLADRIKRYRIAKLLFGLDVTAQLQQV